MTVVPADANSGELSYVLIVQQPDELKEGEQTDDQDMTGNFLFLKICMWLKGCKKIINSLKDIPTIFQEIFYHVIVP